MNKSFAAQVSNFNEEALKVTGQIKRDSVLELFRAVVFDTPVQEGVLRANWRCSVAAPITEIDYTSTNANYSLNEINEVVGSSELKDVLYLQNNMPYGPVIEYGLYPDPPKNPTGKTMGGYSTKAPEGMVQRNVIRFEGIVKKYARRKRNVST